MQIKTERPHWVTLKLSDKEKRVLSAMAAEMGMSQQAVLRQALRVYQQSLKGKVDLGPMLLSDQDADDALRAAKRKRP